MIDIIGAFQLVVTNALSGRSRVDELSIAHIDAHMTHLGAAAGLREEDQVTGQQLRLFDTDRIGVLRGRGVGKGNAEMGEYILCKAGAIKTAGACPAVNIFAAEETGGIIDDVLSGPAGGRGRPGGNGTGARGSGRGSGGNRRSCRG